VQALLRLAAVRTLSYCYKGGAKQVELDTLRSSALGATMQPLSPSQHTRAPALAAQKLVYPSVGQEGPKHTVLSAS
jgi:hypothetical protein